ncbi:hypothetical protein SVIOM74S_03872 [Streptomyces violarus]
MAFGKLLWVLAAGCIPFASFFVEPKVSREAQALVTKPAAEDREGLIRTAPRPPRVKAPGRFAIDIY